MTAPSAFDVRVPDELEVGRGAILLVRGWILPPPRARLRGFVVELDGETQRFDPQGEIRFDLPADRGRPPLGVFLPVEVPARLAGRTVQLRVVADTGTPETLVDQSIDLLAPGRETLAFDTPIVICLGSYNPDEALLVRQLDSLRAQSRRDWACLIHDDGSTLAHYATLRRHVDGDRRFVVVRAEHNRGFYRNFEAALALVPSTTPYVALCDQDDYWYPDKLEATIAALDAAPDAQLAYCDMRIVARDGAVRSPTYWKTRRNNYRNFDTLLFANTVTGAASVFRGALLDALLPFPPAQGPSFHDHWLACAAFVAGGIAYVDRPLYDYTQHATNVIGHSDFGALTVGETLLRHARNTVEMLVKPPRTLDNVWAMLAFYHYGYRRLQLIAATLRLRFADAGGEIERTLALFDDRLPRAATLMLSRHLSVVRRGDTTDMAEFKLGMGLLLHKALSPALIPLISAKRRLWPSE
jgi:glycosyltransferase involved in cell wall biosynthesis